MDASIAVRVDVNNLSIFSNLQNEEIILYFRKLKSNWGSSQAMYVDTFFGLRIQLLEVSEWRRSLILWQKKFVKFMNGSWPTDWYYFTSWNIKINLLLNFKTIAMLSSENIKPFTSSAFQTLSRKCGKKDFFFFATILFLQSSLIQLQLMSQVL